MKIKTLALAAALAAIVTPAVLAADPAKEAPAKEPSAEAPKKTDVQAVQSPKATELTGSYIKRPIRHNGKITDGPHQVIVLDRDMIERSGAADLKQVLVRQGIH